MALRRVTQPLSLVTVMKQLLQVPFLPLNLVSSLQFYLVVHPILLIHVHILLGPS